MQPSGGSRHSNKRGPHHVADPDIQLGGNLIFSPVSHVSFFVGGGKVFSQTRGGRGHGRISTLDPSQD